MKKIKILILMAVAAFFVQSCVDESGEYVRQMYTNSQKETAFTTCLTTAADSAISHLCVANGFSQYENGQYSINYEDLQSSVFQMLRENAQGYLADSLILLSNRVAENCNSSVVSPLFTDAIKSLTFYNHDDLINGEETAITDFFVRFKDADMKAGLQSPVSIRMNLFGVNDCWDQIVARYYQLGGGSISFDVQNYIIDKMLKGLYEEMRIEEVNIRTDSTHRVSADSLLAR